MHRGVITSLHQKMAGSSNYYSSLHALQYDILYGESYCYGGVKPYVATEMQMGIDPITIRVSGQPVSRCILSEIISRRRAKFLSMETR